MLELKKIWIRTERPVLTYIIVSTCLIVTLSIYFFPELNSVLNAENSIRYPWQRFMAIFAHGAGPAPIFAHLVGNLTGLLVFGCFTEKLIGSIRYSALCATCVIVFLLHFTLTNGYGNGVSVIAWGVLPFGAYMLISEKLHGLKPPLSKLHIFMVILLIWAWFLFPLIIGANRYHETSTFIGCIFLLLSRSVISERIEIINNGSTILEKKSIRYSMIALYLSIPVFAVSLIVLYYAGILH